MSELVSYTHTKVPCNIDKSGVLTGLPNTLYDLPSQLWSVPWSIWFLYWTSHWLQWEWHISRNSCLYGANLMYTIEPIVFEIVVHYYSDLRSEFNLYKSSVAWVQVAMTIVVHFPFSMGWRLSCGQPGRTIQLLSMSSSLLELMLTFKLKWVMCTIVTIPVLAATVIREYFELKIFRALIFCVEIFSWRQTGHEKFLTTKINIDKKFYIDAVHVHVYLCMCKRCTGVRVC